MSMSKALALGGADFLDGLFLFFGILIALTAIYGIIAGLCSGRQAFLRVFSPRVWLTFWGLPFFVVTVVQPLSGFLTNTPIDNWFTDTATAEWDTSKPHAIFIAAHYEGFWDFVLIAFSFMALSFAWLFDDRRTRAKLAVIFGVAMLGCFVPGLCYVGFAYDKQRPMYLFWVLGSWFAGILISGLAHLALGDTNLDDNVNSKAEPLLGR
eukprot:TRINITY_DN43650_c0_g1_i1.p1 TRINITY_DN43650_c0_g1~~TRINITY_DN43650_c0_g1_i1.p1  ORF type:complete len:209 (-),score=14.15 TRINITY_DN43650_c0_g1_i1:99-725(-)